jgi:hypothetical protein
MNLHGSLDHSHQIKLGPPQSLSDVNRVIPNTLKRLPQGIL